MSYSTELAKPPIKRAFLPYQIEDTFGFTYNRLYYNGLHFYVRIG